MYFKPLAITKLKQNGTIDNPIKTDNDVTFYH